MERLKGEYAQSKDLDARRLTRYLGNETLYYPGATTTTHPYPGIHVPMYLTYSIGIKGMYWKKPPLDSLKPTTTIDFTYIHHCTDTNVLIPGPLLGMSIPSPLKT